MQNINDKVIDWIKEKFDLDVSKLAHDDARIRRNTDGTILINWQFLQEKGLDKEYMAFLESLKTKN